MEEITSRKNPLIGHLRRLGADRAYRDDRGEFLADGIKLYREAVEWGVEITCVLTADRALAETLSGRVVVVPADVLGAVSPMRAPQPLVFSCRRPEPDICPSPERVLVLDGVQDPGNVGTIIRSAGAFCTDQVILTGDCADLYNPKTVRAAMGALFRQRVCRMEPGELAAYAEAGGLTLLGAALSDGGLTAGEKLPDRVAVAVGSEGRGLSPAVLDICGGTVRIPMAPACESLNVGIAASILLWEVFRQRGRGTGWQS